MKIGFGWLTDNWGIKLVSLFLAIGFWFYAVGEESIEITKTVPITLLPPNEKLSVVRSSTYFLEVTFRAPRNLIQAVSSDTIGAFHKIEEVTKPGDYSFNVQPGDFSLPAPTIGIIKISPPVVTVALDEMIVKKLPVQVELAGEPAYGYRTDAKLIELDPNAVLVEGPKAVLETMDAIKTEPVQLVGRVRSFRRTVKIQQPEGIRVTGDAITEIQVPVKAEFSERKFAEVPVKPLGSVGPDHYAALRPEQVPVVFKGPRAVLDKLTPGDFVVYADIDGLKEGAYELPAKFVLAPDTVLKDDPPTISVEVKKL